MRQEIAQYIVMAPSSTIGPVKLMQWVEGKRQFIFAVYVKSVPLYLSKIAYAVVKELFLNPLLELKK